jgi:putative methionine-R-sulfoxide reductase with GAF domain
LKSTICVPLLRDGRLTGVFTGYSSQEIPFDERHRYAVERVAELLDARLTSFGLSTSNIRAFPATRHH